MDKETRTKGTNILKYFSKASFVIPSRPYSLGRDRRPEHLAKAKAFSGPIVLIVPEEARHKKKAGVFETQEPTSPKVSCIGQIKHKKKAGRCKRPPAARQERRRPSFAIWRIFRRKVRPTRSSDPVEDADERRPAAAAAAAAAPAPPLGQMRRFTSGREAFAGFDWREAQRAVKSYAENDDDDEVIIHHSAPILMGGCGVAVEPKKEVSLWKRRTMVPPSPLQLKS